MGGSTSAPNAFGADLADLSELIDRFLDPRRWPVFSLPLAGHGRLHVVMRNFEDEGGVDYVLEPRGGAESITLAAMEGHFRGPALAWTELAAAAQQPTDLRLIAVAFRPGSPTVSKYLTSLS